MSEPERQETAERGAPRRGGWSFRIGTLLGIPIRVHFTFLLLLVWFGSVSSEQGRGFLGGVVFLVLLFACVVLHELGHALAARRYGVRTSEIVLYPIGGVARLERLPSGKAELVIAIAGPVVNLVLAALLWGGLRLTDARAPGLSEDLLTAAPVAWQLLAANLTLFFFNLIPAFPMDGGRILRAALSIFLGQTRATTIAARIGQGLALLFAILAIYPPPVRPTLLLIAMFVFLGAGQENAYQRGRAAVRGLTARQAMVTRFETLAPQDSLERAAQLLLATHQQDFPVVDLWGRVAGVLPRAGLLAALSSGGRERAVLEAMDREVTSVAPETPLEEVLARFQASPGKPIVVVGERGLEGMITLENFGELIEVSKSLGPRAGTEA
jgi:stage IV sporulation protein FB